MIFFFTVVVIADFVFVLFNFSYGGLHHVKPSLDCWAESNLLMMGELFGAFLDLVCKYFTKYFSAALFIRKFR